MTWRKDQKLFIEIDTPAQYSRDWREKVSVQLERLFFDARFV
jgi:hypothetical protein